MGVPLFIIHFILGCAIINHPFGGSTIYHRILLVPPPHRPPQKNDLLEKTALCWIKLNWVDFFFCMCKNVLISCVSQHVWMQLSWIQLNARFRRNRFFAGAVAIPKEFYEIMYIPIGSVKVRPPWLLILNFAIVHQCKSYPHFSMWIHHVSSSFSE